MEVGGGGMMDRGSVGLGGFEIGGDRGRWGWGSRKERRDVRTRGGVGEGGGARDWG